MGTCSSIGIHVNGTDKLTYNHYDGYPTDMGQNVFEQVCDLIKNEGWDKIKKMATKMRQVKADKKFTVKQKEKYGHYWEQVDTGLNMYALLRGLQGKLGLMMKEGIMVGDNDFILDSLFCEWAYIFNVDDKTFEIYQGFQLTPPTFGRYKDAPADRGYYACNLIHTIDLSHGVAELYNALVVDDAFWQKLEDPIEEEIA
jgi:hypothetical protein